VALNVRQACIIKELDRIGIVHPSWTIELARKNNIPISLAASILIQESGGGRNVFGHDPFLRPTRLLDWLKGRKVTAARYRYYKRMRKHGHGMQGVGPLQLTWFAFQDEADKNGGAHRPFVNMQTGFGLLGRLLRAHPNDVRGAVALYNGQGVAADHYAAQVLARADDIHDHLKHCQ
jgi:hypothetical protein